MPILRRAISSSSEHPRLSGQRLPRWLRILACALLAGNLAACNTVLPTVDQDATLPRFQINANVFHGEAFGSPNHPTLMVVHGGPGADYRYLLGLNALADSFQVVFYDQTGSGLSPRVPAGELSVDRFVQDLDDIVQHISPGQPVYLLGHSWGAMLATAYVGAHPDKVGKLVLAEPGFLDPATLADLPQTGWPGMAVVWGFARAWLGKWLVTPHGDTYARDDWFLTQVLPLTQTSVEACTGKPTHMAAWRFGHPAFQATIGRLMDDPAWGHSLDFTRGLDRYTGPVLFIRGACSVQQGEAQQRNMMARFRPVNRAQLVTIEQAGHFMFNDQPEASLGAVRAFLTAPP